MRQPSIAILMLLASALLPGLGAASTPMPWPEGVEVQLPPGLGGAPPGHGGPDAGEGPVPGASSWAAWLLAAGEDGWCAAREHSGAGSCGSSPAPDLAAVLRPPLPAVPGAPVAPGLAQGAAPPLAADAPAGTAAPGAGAAPAAEAAQEPDAAAWQLLRATSESATADPAKPSHVLAQPVHVANPVPNPGAQLPDAAGPALAPLALPVPGVVIHWAGHAALGEVADAAHAGALSPAEAPEGWLAWDAPGSDAPTAPDGAPARGPSPPALAPEAPARSSGVAPRPAEPPAWDRGEVAAGLLVGGALLLPAWALYRRIREGRALDQPQRKVIYDRVVADPGATPADLRAATGLHYTTCLHHLRVLERLGFVELKRIGGQVRCFENHSRYGAVEARALAAARSATARRLLALALERPGLSPAEAARALGVGRSTLKHHADRLAAWGLLQAESDGAHVRLRVPAAAMPAVASAASRQPPAA